MFDTKFTWQFEYAEITSRAIRCMTKKKNSFFFEKHETGGFDWSQMKMLLCAHGTMMVK